MVGRRDLLAQTVYDLLRYISGVKETLRDEPEAFQKFLKAVNVMYRNVGVNLAIARVEQIIKKDHPELLPGFKVYLPNIIKGLELEKNMDGKRVKPKISLDDALTYAASVKVTFADEPAKFDEFLKILKEATSDSHRVDKVRGIAKMKELMKDQPDLLLGLNEFLSAKTKRRINERTFLMNLKKRFLNPRVFESYRKIMVELEQKKKSREEVHEEVVSLLSYHEDLIEEFSRIFLKH